MTEIHLVWLISSQSDPVLYPFHGKFLTSPICLHGPVSHFNYMFLWLYRHMIDLSHIDVSIIDGWGTSQFVRRTEREANKKLLWTLEAQSGVQSTGSCVEVLSTIEKLLHKWIKNTRWGLRDTTADELMLWMTLTWRFALSVHSFVFESQQVEGKTLVSLNQPVKRDDTKTVCVADDNSCSHPLTFKTIKKKMLLKLEMQKVLLIWYCFSLTWLSWWLFWSAVLCAARRVQQWNANLPWWHSLVSRAFGHKGECRGIEMQC